MRPNDSFSFLPNQIIDPNLKSLARYYLPIMGSQALALYSCLLAFDDQGAKAHSFSSLLNHLNVGMAELEASFEALVALHLIKLYQIRSGYLVALQSPLDAAAFFDHQVLTQLLERKIGDAALKAMRPRLPEMAKPLDKSMIQVFGSKEELKLTKPAGAVKGDFDLAHFKQLMGRDGLRFEDEQTSILSLFELAETYQKTWFDLYQLAKETAVDGVIVPKRLANRLASPKQVTEPFSVAEQQLISLANQRQALAFLTDVKNNRQAQVIGYERQLLKQMGQLGLLDAVINVIVLYSLNQTTSANLNEKFALKVANDFSYQGIKTAEEAVLALRNWGDKKANPQKGAQKKASVSNVPEWSKEDYRTEATPEELAELQDLRRQMLGDKET